MALHLSLRAPVCRPAAARPARRAVISRAPATHRMVWTRSNAADVGAKVQDAIKEADETCAKGTTADCAVAWDTVEELSKELDKKKQQEVADSDPLEQYCKDVPEADECRVYED